MLKELFSKNKKKKKFELKKVGHVQHDWMIALLVSVIAVLIVIAVNTLIFLQVSKPNEVLSGGSQGSKLVDQELLEYTLDFYKEKEERFLKYKREIPNAPDI